MPPIFQALFIDVPSLIDSAWRHVEYALNAESDYEPGAPPGVAARPFWTKPPFWFFAVTVFFVSYGPTWDGLCAIAPQHVTDALRQVVGVLIVFGSLALATFLGWKTWELIRRRFEAVEAGGQTPSFARRATAVLVVYAALVALAAIGAWAGAYVYSPSPDRACAVADGSRVALLRLALCGAAILAFAWIASSRRASIRVDVVAQAVILVAVALIQWFGLTSATEREASDLPYRHVFLVWAPCIVAVTVLAPWLARRAFGESVPPATRQRLRQLLQETELFVKRPPDPELTGRRIIHALVYGPAYHPLHLLLIPALIALAAPVKWLYPWVIGAFVVSVLLLTWGNISSRWQQMVTYVERWFLRGTPLLISLFVIVVAILRLVKFDYVSTLLDTIPFGMIFGLVAMNYVLFWLAEYWMSRAAAAQLLELLGPVQDETRIPYSTAEQDPDIHVDRAGRILASHGTGRFAVVGTGHDRQRRLVTAFHTYYLMELFSRLGKRTGEREDHDRVSDINRRTGMYFLRLNALMVLVTAGFIGVFAWEHYWANNRIEPVVRAQAAPPAQGLADLAGRLRQDASARPAIVVIGSGGGTRAALYTASVLDGLHRLGVDRDIELLSGVSGGGVALAYFAANSAALTAAASGGAPRPDCPADRNAPRSVAQEWACFTRAVTKPFIEDVLNGASEWRVFRTTALTELLAESFERNLFPRRPTLGSLDKPALILNAAIVAHPEEESQALSRTIEPDAACEERERPYKLLGGGRLIFTNLRDTDRFPGSGSAIPDIRLPYRIVRDPTVPLASAAALNANFPPVFPNARVRIEGDGPGDCKERSYYVTDGGAQENLGLISALYALDSALARLADGARVRPIHVVIAEASAVSYDYAQDHGISAGVSGSRERLAGGLTNLLIDRVDRQLQRLNGETAAVRYHYLGLPLAFRARGGFGTHWLYAKEFHLDDPRPRTTFALNLRPTALGSEQKAAITQSDLERLWLALHDPGLSFCEPGGRFATPDPEKVRQWVCGSAWDEPHGRDLHMQGWKTLVETLRP